MLLLLLLLLPLVLLLRVVLQVVALEAQRRRRSAEQIAVNWLDAAVLVVVAFVPVALSVVSQRWAQMSVRQ